MLIGALCDYYDVLADSEKLISPEYSEVGIHYLIDLNADGSIGGITDCQIRDPSNPKGKPQPKKAYLPRRTEKPGIESNFIEHRSLYIFGISYNKETDTLSATDRTDKGKKSHAAFAEYNLKMLEGLDTDLINAYRNFILNWVPENETENPWLIEIAKKLGGSYFAFCLCGKPDKLLHEQPEIQERWRQICAQTESEEADIAQCPIMGDRLPVARIHGKIRGVIGGQSSGTALVSYNSSAEESYGKSQSFNSNISEAAAEKYTTALNYLLASRRHRTVLDGVTVLHWAKNDSEACDDLFSSLCLGDSSLNAEKVDEILKQLLNDIREGTLFHDAKCLTDMDSDTEFYIVGIKPNAARLSIKFIQRNNFGRIIDNVARHIADIQVGDQLTVVPIWKICKELISPKSTDEKVDPSLMANLFSAIINNTPYPTTLLSTLIRRVRTDGDTGIKSTELRMGMIKACINRNLRNRGKKEEITLALNMANQNPAYLCGRLFAVLEDVQLKAANYNLNRTIKDAYFASACVRPATVFPKLLSLSQHHMSKLGNSRFEDEAVGQIMDQIGATFPNMLSLQEQGIFMLGYYQQKCYTKEEIRKYKEAKNNG